MIKNLLKILMTVVILSVVHGCKNDKGVTFFSLTPETVSVEYSGGVKELSLSTDGGWSIEIPETDTWVKITPMSGKGSSKLTVTISANTSPLERKSRITVNSSGQSSMAKIAVTQEAYNKGGSYQDGEYRVYEMNRREKASSFIIIGDGFIEADFTDGGAFDVAAKTAVEAIFRVEPYKTYRSYFNVYKVAAISKERGASQKHLGITRNTAFGATFKGDENSSAIESNYIKVFEYAAKIPGVDINQSAIILIINEKRYGGTCYMVSNGRSVAMCPMDDGNGYPRGFENIVTHEAGGHGFGRLADEYIVDDVAPDAAAIEELKLWQSFDYYSNVSYSNEPSKLVWRDFIGRAGYGDVDVFEGGFTYKYGIWRPEPLSCMDLNIPYFNVQSRVAIVKRLLSIAGETFSLDGFVARDAVKSLKSAMPQRKSVVVDGSAVPRLAPPILVRE